MLSRFLELVIRRRFTSLGVAALLFVAAVCSLPWLHLDDSPERWMPKSSVGAWVEFDRHFAHGDSIGIAVHFHRPVKNEDIEYIARLRKELLSVPEVGNVIDMSVVVQKIEGVPLTEIVREPADRHNDRYKNYRGVLFDDPVQWRSDKNPAPDERTLISYLEMKTGRKSVETNLTAEEEHDRRKHAVTEINRILEEMKRDDVTLHVIGAIVIQNELERIARRIVFVLVPASLLLTFLALGIGFRSFSAVILAIAAAMWSVTILLGGVVWAGWSLNVVTVGGPTLMLVITVATVVHFCHYDADRPVDLSPVTHRPITETPSLQTPETARRSSHFVRWVGVPCFGAAITTGFGFLMLMFNELSPTRELGAELFVGAVLAFFGAFLIRLILPPGKPQQGHWLNPDRLRSMHNVLVSRPRTMIGIMAIVTAGLAAGATRISIEADPFSFFHADSPMTKSFRHIGDRHFGMYLLDVALIPKNRPDDPAQRRIEEQKDREAALQFQNAIAGRPEVHNVVSTMKFREQMEKGLQSEMNGVSATESFQRANAYFQSFEPLFKSWMVDQAEQGALRVTFKVDDPGQGFGDLVDAVRENLPTDRFDCVYTGTAADVVVLGEGLLGGMLKGLSLAFCVMAAVCVVWFRSLRLTVLAFFPNIFPILFVLGVMGFCGVSLNSGSAMVTTIALGVALNDTVHFIMHYDQRRRQGEPCDRAITETFTEIGRPIVLTSVVNCFGFAIFLLSDFRPMWDFGLLTGLAMLAALIGDLVLLPNLLKVFDRRDRTKTPQETEAVPVSAALP